LVDLIAKEKARKEEEAREEGFSFKNENLKL